MIAQVIEMCQSDIEAKELRLRLELRARDFYVAADEAKFNQIIWNLLKNAIKFTPAKGAISIGSSNDGAGRLSITVQDTGIGIEPEIIERVFNAFEQGDESLRQRHGGLGLGLAISKAIVEAHDGSLGVRSDGRDRGSTFA